MEQLHKLWNSKPVRYARSCVSLYFEKRIPQASAGLAYFLLLTVFPLIICVNAFLGLLNLDPMEVMAVLEGIVPESSVELIRVYLNYISGNQSAGLLAAGVIMAFTSSSAAFRTIMRVMADLYEVPPLRGLRGLLLSIISPVGLILTIYVSIGVIVTGDWLLSWLAQEFHWAQILFIWRQLRFVLLFLVFFLFVYLASHLAAPRKTPRGPLLIGSIISTCALTAFSILFSWFISMSTRYSLVYGSLVSIVVLLVWLYLCGNILLAGNVISSVWYRKYQGLIKASFFRKRDRKEV